MTETPTFHTEIRARQPSRQERNRTMIVLARISTDGTTNNRDIVRRLMECEAFRFYTVADVAATLRSYDRSGLVERRDGWLTIYHNCDN